MQKRLTALLGIALILLGLAALAGNMVLSALGVRLYWWEVWRLWPMIVIGLGILLCAAPFLSLKQRALGVFFIPGLLVLTNGGILLLSSLFSAWNIWSLLWPLEVLALAAGFVLAAFFCRLIWFGIPAIVLGLNGLALLFCSLTGLWSWWAVLWAIEPLTVGLCLLLIAAALRSPTLAVIGIVCCSFAALAFIGMTALLTIGGWLFRLTGPIILILMGLLLVMTHWLRPKKDL